MQRPLFGLTILAMLSACAVPPPPSRAETPLSSPQDIGCLREAIYFEAGNAPQIGQEAVAHVILNRVEDPRFPKSVCGVVQEGEDVGRCQFSYRCQLDPDHIRWPQNMRRADETVQAIVAGETTDPTGGALFFHAKRMAPGWFATLKRVGEFGGNIFYDG